MLMMQPGIIKGEMRRGPRLTIASLLAQMEGRPPMPAPIATPVIGAFSSVISRPESSSAIRPAATPKCTKRSKRRTSLTPRYFAASKSFTSPAIWQPNSEGSKAVMRPMPLLPSSAFFQLVARSAPRGETMPRPVTTTRRFIISKNSLLPALSIQKLRRMD